MGKMGYSSIKGEGVRVAYMGERVHPMHFGEVLGLPFMGLHVHPMNECEGLGLGLGFTNMGCRAWVHG